MKSLFRTIITAARHWPRTLAGRPALRTGGEKSRRRSAFSLIELMSVMAIVTVVAGISVPAVKGVGGSNGLNAGAGKISGLLSLARSEAIAQHTIVRFVVATGWGGQEREANSRRMSLWAWRADIGQFEALTAWEELPTGVILESELPAYVRTSSYAADDASTVRGGCVLGEEFAADAGFTTTGGQGQISGRFIEFLPSGAARIPNSAERRAIFVATQGFAEAGRKITYTAQSNGQPLNWAQVNVDTLTGRVHVYRP